MARPSAATERKILTLTILLPLLLAAAAVLLAVPRASADLFSAAPRRTMLRGSELEEVDDGEDGDAADSAEDEDCNQAPSGQAGPLAKSGGIKHGRVEGPPSTPPSGNTKPPPPPAAGTSTGAATTSAACPCSAGEQTVGPLMDSLKPGSGSKTGYTFTVAEACKVRSKFFMEYNNRLLYIGAHSKVKIPTCAEIQADWKANPKK